MFFPSAGIIRIRYLGMISARCYVAPLSLKEQSYFIFVHQTIKSAIFNHTPVKKLLWMTLIAVLFVISLLHFTVQLRYVLSVTMSEEDKLAAEERMIEDE